MAEELAAAITSFVIAFLIIPVIIKYSLRKNLVDIPGRRKIHKVTLQWGLLFLLVFYFFSYMDKL
jgi:UDP-N-acetylmuramyl pentapeptide phosphotransferase/UDP-N-acetylglucosamine-1-phosphate transferase